MLPGTDVHSDEWRAYSQLKTHKYNHYTVNHKKNFVNPKTGKHTQLIECLWGIAKAKITKAKRGSPKHLQGYLAEQWFRSINSKNPPELFVNVMKLVML